MKSFCVKLFPIIILCCLGFLVYSNSFQNSFHFDDFPSITDNSAIRHIGNLQGIWNYWPTRFLTYFSVALNYQWGGYGVLGYHIFNFLTHLACGILLWWLTVLTFNTPALKKEAIARHAKPLAFFAAAIFLLHPIQTQPVDYIIQRATLLAALFYIASLSLYVKTRLIQGQEGGTRIWQLYFGGSLLSACAGMFCKEITISLPLTVCLYEFCFLRNKKSPGWKYVIVYFLVALIIPLTMILGKLVDFQKARFVNEAGPGISSWHYFLTQTRVLVTYLRLLFVPVNQNLDYYYPASRSLFEAPVLFSLLLLALVISAGARLFRKYRLPSFCVSWFFITLLLESSFFPIADVIFEHRLYLPMAGFSIFLVSALYYLLEEKGFKVTVAILSVLVLFYSMASHQRNKVWKDEFTLWDDAARKSPQKARPYVNRGQAYQKKGRINLALTDYNKAIAIKSTYAEAFNNRAMVYQDSGSLDMALADYNKAVEINPKYAEAYVNRGIAYAKKGEAGLAFADFAKALEVLPDCAEAYVNRGTLYAKEGNLDLALADYNKAIDSNPYLVKPRFNRGLAFQNKGSLGLALIDYSKAIQLDPGYTDAYINRAWVNFVSRQYDKAWDDVRKAQGLGSKIEPAFLEALKNASGREK